METVTLNEFLQLKLFFNNYCLKDLKMNEIKLINK